MRGFLVFCALVFASLAYAEDAKSPTVDMTTVLLDSKDKPFRDCPAGHDMKADPEQTQCPEVTLGMAASYVVSFAIESDRTLDWKERASLRVILESYMTSKVAPLTNKQRDDLMNRIGNVYKLLPHGDEVIVAAMKILQPVEFGKMKE